MNTRRFALTPAACAAALLVAGTAFAQDGAPATDDSAVPTVVISASADASAQGLPAA